MEPAPTLVRIQQRQNTLTKVIAFSSVLIMLVLLVFSYRNLAVYVAQNEDIRRSHEVIRELEQVLSIVKDADAGACGYLLSNNDDFLQPYDQATGTLAPHLDGLATLLAGDTASLNTISAMRSRIDAKLESLHHMISDQRGGLHPAGKPDSTVLRESKENMDALRRMEMPLLDHYSRMLGHQEADDRTLRFTGPGMIATYAAIALLCMAILFFRMFRNVERAQAAEHLALVTAAALDKEARTRELAERSLKRVLDSSQSGIMAFRAIRNEQGVITDLECTRMNEAAENILHRKADEVMQHTMLASEAQELLSPLFSSYARIVETGEPLRTESAYTHDGQTSTLAISAVRLLDGLVVTFTDITEAKRQAILVQEGERLSVTGRFARMVGHEVRNPLTNIQLALDQLESEGTQVPEQQIYLDILRRNSQRIGQLITEMLHTSRPLEVKMVSGDLNAVLASALAQVKDRCELRKVKSVLDAAPGLRNIPIDKATLTVAFTNLLVNAVEATEEGKGEVRVRSEQVKDRIQITVQDNGKGMSPEDRERIFQPFFSGRTGGMGLGLTEARNILNAHGVLLTVESELGKGTTFRLLFPA